jgi:hypothetical protein
MIAGLLPTANIAIHLRICQAVSERRTEQKMVDPKARVAAIGISKIIPECVDRLVGMDRPQRIRPAPV